MQSYWFGDVEAGTCTPFFGDPRAIVERVSAITISTDTFVPLQWEDTVPCGVCRDRAVYLSKLREICFAAAESEIRGIYAGKDAELLQMVRMLDEMDTVINLLSERATDWHQIRHPTFSRKYHRTPAPILVRNMSEKSRGALGRVANQIESLSATRTDLAKEVSGRANQVIPNTSALIGGLVAARLVSQAGGLVQLARLPASAIQVIGARTALFAHLRSHTPSPKHGIIFQHRRVHNAPRPVRGRVARVLAGKLAIAAKIDLYRGVGAPEFIASAQEQIDAAGEGTKKE